MNIELKGYMESVATFYADNATPEYPVKISANKKVADAANGDIFAGIAVNFRPGVAGSGFAGVQTAGYAELPFSGTAPALGYKELAADGAGGVKAVTAGTGRVYLVVNADANAKRIGFIL